MAQISYSAEKQMNMNQAELTNAQKILKEAIAKTNDPALKKRWTAASNELSATKNKINTAYNEATKLEVKFTKDKSALTLAEIGAEVERQKGKTFNQEQLGVKDISLSNTLEDKTRDLMNDPNASAKISKGLLGVGVAELALSAVGAGGIMGAASTALTTALPLIGTGITTLFGCSPLGATLLAVGVVMKASPYIKKFIAKVTHKESKDLEAKLNGLGQENEKENSLFVDMNPEENAIENNGNKPPVSSNDGTSRTTTPPSNNNGGTSRTNPPSNNNGGASRTTPPSNNNGGASRTNPPVNNNGGNDNKYPNPADIQFPDIGNAQENKELKGLAVQFVNTVKEMETVVAEMKNVLPEFDQEMETFRTGVHEDDSPKTAAEIQNDLNERRAHKAALMNKYNALKQKLDQLHDKMHDIAEKYQGTELATNLGTAINDFVRDMGDKHIKPMNKEVSNFEAEFAKYEKEATNNLKAAFEEEAENSPKVQELKNQLSEVRQLADQLKDALRAGKDAKDIYAQMETIVNGMETSLNSMQGALSEKDKQIAEVCVNTAKSTLVTCDGFMRNPSKVPPKKQASAPTAVVPVSPTPEKPTAVMPAENSSSVKDDKGQNGNSNNTSTLNGKLIPDNGYEGSIKGRTPGEIDAIINTMPNRIKNLEGKLAADPTNKQLQEKLLEARKMLAAAKAAKEAMASKTEKPAAETPSAETPALGSGEVPALPAGTTPESKSKLAEAYARFNNMLGNKTQYKKPNMKGQKDVGFGFQNANPQTGEPRKYTVIDEMGLEEADKSSMYKLLDAAMEAMSPEKSKQVTGAEMVAKAEENSRLKNAAKEIEGRLGPQ